MYLGREATSALQRAQGARDGGEDGRDDEVARVTTIRSIRQPVATLSGGQRQSVAVARAVMWNSRLVILDEPTAALGVAQTAQVLELVARLAEQGLAVVLISHNLHDIFAVADRITVLRLGYSIGVYEREKTTQQEVDRRDHRRRRRRRSRESPNRGRGDRMSTQADSRLPDLDPTGVAAIRVTGSASNDHARATSAAGRSSSCWRSSSSTSASPPTTSSPPVNFNNIIRPDGRHDDARLRRRLRAPDRRDRPLDRLRQRCRRHHRRAASRCRSGHQIPDIGPIPAGVLAIGSRSLACAAIGLFQGSIVALIGVPAFVVTLAGLPIWQGVIQKALPEQVIVIQDNTVNNVAGLLLQR